MKSVDICVIGGGSGGLAVAAGAVQMGASVALFERAKMGGDCLNYGCVPSKALLAAARSAACPSRSARFGIDAPRPHVDFAAVHAHVHGVIASIAPHDSVERFQSLGVEVVPEHARFVARDTVAGDGGTQVRARRFVIATGSAPAAPPIPGLDAVPYLTNETIFAATKAPEHLIIIGGGPIGAELAQAHRRLGAKVTIIEMFALLGRDDPELAGVVRARLAEEGVEIIEGVKVLRVEAGEEGNNVAVVFARDGVERRVTGSHLLVAAGRRANVDGLDLEKAGVAYTAKGIATDARLRTSNRRIFAVGDVAGRQQFTHTAAYHAGIVIRNALFKLPAKLDERAMPAVTYTDPELASVGLSEAAAAEAGRKIRVLRAEFAEIDRARAERETDGLLKAITDGRGRVLGAAIVGPHAGELIMPWVLAVQNRMKIAALANAIAPYPTFSEITKKAAGSYYTPALFSARTRAVVRFLQRLG